MRKLRCHMINKKLLIVGLASAVLIVGCSKEEKQPDPSTLLQSLEQKVNYTIAQNLANNFKQSGVTIEPETFALALRDVRDGAESRLSDEEMQTVMQTFQEQAMAQREEEQKKIAEENAAAGAKFLEENKAKERSEEHTSELQSRENLVCRLLLE